MTEMLPKTDPAPDDESSLEAAYQKRILRYLVFIGTPFILIYAVVALFLSAPWYVMGLYLLSVAILGVGFRVLMRPMEAARFLRIHRLVSIGYIGTLVTVQVISIAAFNRLEFSAWILFYPSMVFLFMNRKDALPSVIICGLAFFPILFLSPPVAIPAAGILSTKLNLLLIFVLVAACTYFIDATRRRFQGDLIRRQQEALRMKLAAEQASKAKSQFLGNMSHELRTPLNHIIGFTELLLDSADERHDEASVEYLSDVLESGRHLLLLVNDALDLVRVEEGRLELTMRLSTARDLLEKSVNLVSERARAKDIAVSLAPDIPPRAFAADERRLKQVLVNLLVNAVKFTPAGGRVVAGCRMVEGSATREEMVEFSVSDTGIGISPEELPLLFERFTRLERPGYGTEQGAGLGLALSRGIVEEHGGTIWAESEGEGKGSTFRFVVPAR